MAIRHPDRVRSLTSIMSTPSMSIGKSTPEVQAAFSAPPPTSLAEVVNWTVALFEVISSPGYPMEEGWIREVAGQSYDRSFDPAGVARQGLAVYASGDRTAALARVTVPALVIHGEADPVFQLPAARWSRHRCRTAQRRAARGARLGTRPAPRDLADAGRSDQPACRPRRSPSHLHSDRVTTA